MKVELIETRDGSSSLYVPDLDETYHSTHGALAESKYVFIQHGLQHYTSTNNLPSIRILEVGFGTGLNALLTAGFADKAAIRIDYDTLEPFPLDLDIINSLNYLSKMDDHNWHKTFNDIHHASWGSSERISDTFHIRKIQKQLMDYESEAIFDVIYFDAFAPSKQPEMWTETVFNHISKMMKKRGILITYCAQGQFKRNLKSSGFTVESLPGPPPKKEMVRATKP